MAALKQEPAHYITINERRLPLIIKKHPRARHMIVRYDVRTEAVQLTLPRYVSIKAGLAFADTRKSWVEKQMTVARRVAFDDGVLIPLWGREVKLVYKGGRDITSLVGDELHVTGAQESMVRRVRDYLVKEMKQRTAEIAERYANMLGVNISSIRINDARSRWGCCTSKGNLSFSLRLAFAPLEILDYVVCHEVTHIKHLNHSAAYWKTVEMLCPDYRSHEEWLKTKGQSLWVYG